MEEQHLSKKIKIDCDIIITSGNTGIGSTTAPNNIVYTSGNTGIGSTTLPNNKIRGNVCGQSC